MQPGNNQGSQESRSFIEAARREQIVNSAIDAIAEVGYAKASMEQIAKRAGISRGLISYHFAGKNELIAQVLEVVYRQGGEFMGPRVEAESTSAGRLRAYIESNLEYMREHPHRMAAVVEIITGGGVADADHSGVEELVLGPLIGLFRHGQDVGEFRQFDPKVMARALRSVIDGIPPHINDPDLDLTAYAAELTTLFDLATRNASPSGAQS